MTCIVTLAAKENESYYSGRTMNFQIRKRTKKKCKTECQQVHQQYPPNAMRSPRKDRTYTKNSTGDDPTEKQASPLHDLYNYMRLLLSISSVYVPG